MNNNYDVDIHKVLDLFKDLSYKERKKTYKAALRKSLAILSKEARKSLRRNMGNVVSHRNWWNGKTLGSGIRAKVSKSGKLGKVHILGDFRLKFFELGTKKRYLRKSKAYRGKIIGNHFFKEAKQAKLKEAQDSLMNNLIDVINKIKNKKR